MTRSVRLAAVIVAAAVLAAPTAARAAAEARALTLDDALALAKKRNRSLVVEQARLAQAQTNLSSAWALLLPTVAAQGKYTRNYAEFLFPGVPNQMMMMMGQTSTGLLIQPLNQLDAAVSFTAPLLVPAAWSGLQSVKAGIAATEANVEASDANVMFAVAQAFYAAAGADEVLVARNSSIGVARATLANAKTRMAAGTVTKVDVDRAELALVRAEQLERDARHGRNQAYRSLATLIQMPDTERFVVQPPAAIPPTADVPDLQTALSLRPELRSLNLQLQAEELHSRSFAWRWAPSLSAFGNARKFNYDNFRGDRYAWAVGVQLDWVLFDGGNRDAQRHLANAQAVESQAQAAVFADNVRDDMANARGLLETKRHGVAAATRSVELATETIELVRTQYEAGTVTQVDLLQAQDGLVGAQLALVQAKFDVAVADLTLRRAAGTFPPK
jgi:outer membrane protein TolC